MMRIYRNIAFLIVAMTFMSAYVADAMKLNGTRIDKKTISLVWSRTPGQERASRGCR